MTKINESEEASTQEVAATPLESLTTLVLDAADAANDSVEATKEAIHSLQSLVASSQSATRSVQSAPVIFGAITLAIGVVLAVITVVLTTQLLHKSDELDIAISAQKEQLVKTDLSLKNLEKFEDVLKGYEKVADDTTQRAVVTLREQTKVDRMAIQALEVKRLNDLLRPAKSLTDGVQSTDQTLVRVESRLEDIIKLLRSRTIGSAGRASVTEDTKGTAAEVANLKKEIVALRQSLDKNSVNLQPGVPSFRKKTDN